MANEIVLEGDERAIVSVALRFLKSNLDGDLLDALASKLSRDLYNDDLLVSLVERTADGVLAKIGDAA